MPSDAPSSRCQLLLDDEYAENTDFISSSRLFLDDIEPACLAKWSFIINAYKTERSSVCQHADRVDEERRMMHPRVATRGVVVDSVVYVFMNMLAVTATIICVHHHAYVAMQQNMAKTKLKVC